MEEIESASNVVELWNKNLFSSLMKIQEYERIARDGASSIQGLFEINPRDIPYVQFNLLKQIITEMDIFLSNVQVKVNKEFYNKSKAELKIVKEIVDLHPDYILQTKFDQVSQSRTYIIKAKNFYRILETIRTLKEDLVVNLSDILYGFDPNDKSKKRR
jgi:hypothetical protein